MASTGIEYPRRVVVTGAASGIGKATALLLRERGSEVVAYDVDEAGLGDAADAGAEVVAAQVPLQNRGCEPRDIAEGIVYLLSNGASYVTGQALAVDGGPIMY